MRYRKRLLLIIAQCVLFIPIIAADASANHDHLNPSALDKNGFEVLDDPSVTAEHVTTVLEDVHGVKLVNTKVVGDLDLSGSDFTYFGARDTVFSGDVTYSCLHAGKVCTTKTYPEGEDFQFIESEFEGQVNFALSEPERARFRRCNFKQKVNFHSVGATVPQESKPLLFLDEGMFYGDVIFVSMEVKNLSLVEAHFKSSTDFAGAQMEEFNFTRLRADEPIYIRWSQFGDKLVQDLENWAKQDNGEFDKSLLLQVESMFLFWKNNFTQLGYESDSRDVTYEIVKLRRQHPFYLMTPGIENVVSISGLFSLLELLSEWVMAVVIGAPSKFGAAPYLPIGISIVLITLFAIAYRIALRQPDNTFVKTEVHPIESQVPTTFFFSVLYSIDTFVPFVTITGVKDRGWTTKGRTYWFVELPERFIGFAMFTAAAFSVGSYVI